MAEHRCVWRILYVEDRAFVGCVECLDTMPIDEIERRLNATQCLSAEDARDLLDFVWSHLSNNEVETMLRDYAHILEGDDGI
jgi:hypothetical protein